MENVAACVIYNGSSYNVCPLRECALLSDNLVHEKK